MRIPLNGPAYDTNVPNHQQQKCINWYLEAESSNPVSPARNQWILRPTPGITEVVDMGDFDRGRNTSLFQDVTYFIQDDAFGYLESDGTPSYIDFLSSTTTHVSMAVGSDGILMADGTYAYFYDGVTNIFARVTDGDLPANPLWSAWLGGYYILIFADSALVYYSTSGTSWDALDFNTANVASDNLVACIGDHEELWLFGSESTEVWNLTGDANVPLARRLGTSLSKGCKSAATVVQLDNTIYWLGCDRNGNSFVCMADGYNPQIISTAAISTQIDSYETITDAFAFSHRVGIHEFYVLTFPTEQKTWVYDIASGNWHERSSQITIDPTSADYDPIQKAHRVRSHSFSDNTHWILDYYSGAIGKYENDVYTEFDLPIIRHRRTSPLVADWTNMIMAPKGAEHDNKLHSYYNLVLEVEPGVGLSTGQGSDPTINLSISRDGGFTWEDQDSKSLGAMGVYDQQVRWNILGQARSLVLDIQISDPVQPILLGATVDVEKNSN